MSRWFNRLRVALRSFLRPSRLEHELDEEFRYHLDREIAEGQRAGLAPDEARYAALRAMGAIERAKEDCRDVRSTKPVDDFLGDVRYAGRALRRSPGFAMLAAAVMALGIGANTAVFSVVNGVLLKPLPYPGADRIVAIRTAVVTTGEINPLVTLANFRDWREQSSSFEAMATYRGGEAPVTPGDMAEYGQHASVDPQLFQVLAVQPIVGRTFTPEDAMPGAEHPTAAISYTYWQSRFGGDPGILQRTIRVGSAARTIVGVMPPGFHFPNRTDVWTPQPQGTRPPSRTSHSFLAVARLKPGVSLESARTELNTIAARLEQQYPESNKGRGVTAIPLQETLVRDVRLTLYLMWGVVAIVLLIACANTATLLLGKATVRTREMALRTALGASRGRIVRQLMTESLVLALIAGVSGVALAWLGTRVLVALTPADVVRFADTGVDPRVLMFTLAVSLSAGALFGLVPAIHAARVDLIAAIKQGASRATTGRGRISMRGLLVVSEIALAVMLLAGAGLLVKSLIALHRVDLGFRPGNVLVMKATGVRARPDNDAYFRELSSRIASLPGVVAVGATSIPPGDLTNSGDGSYFIDRVPETRDRNLDPRALFTIAAPGTFAALGIPLKQGRDFDDGDALGRPLVAIVNEALVRKSLGGQDPIGRTIFCSFDRKDGMTIVGVVGDVRQRNPAVEPIPDCYMPYRQHAYNNNTLNVVVRTAGDPMTLAAAIRRLSAETAPDVPVSFTTMEATIAKRVEDPRFRAVLVGLFAGLAICLAVAGVYGVMAFAVQQRSREIGLRMALGATRGSVMRLVLGHGLALSAAGLTIGLAAAAATTRLVETMLFQVGSLDPSVYAGVVGLVCAVTLLAGYVPARRAAIVDPVDVLKAD
jgi:putative ABC transport system permease protein